MDRDPYRISLPTNYPTIDTSTVPATVLGLYSTEGKLLPLLSLSSFSSFSSSSSTSSTSSSVPSTATTTIPPVVPKNISSETPYSILPRITEPCWKGIFKHPYGFTEGSTIIPSSVLQYLGQYFRTSIYSSNRNTTTSNSSTITNINGIVPVPNLRIQYTNGVCFIDMINDTTPITPPPPPPPPPLSNNEEEEKLRLLPTTSSSSITNTSNNGVPFSSTSNTNHAVNIIPIKRTLGRFRYLFLFREHEIATKPSSISSSTTIQRDIPIPPKPTTSLSTCSVIGRSSLLSSSSSSTDHDSVYHSSAIAWAIAGIYGIDGNPSQLSIDPSFITAFVNFLHSFTDTLHRYFYSQQQQVIITQKQALSSSLSSSVIPPPTTLWSCTISHSLTASHTTVLSSSSSSSSSTVDTTPVVPNIEILLQALPLTINNPLVNPSVVLSMIMPTPPVATNNSNKTTVTSSTIVSTVPQDTATTGTKRSRSPGHEKEMEGMIHRPSVPLSTLGTASSASSTFTSATVATPTTTATSTTTAVHLAIIVPFRDQPEQNRGEQLLRFANYIPQFLQGKNIIPKLGSFHIFVIEQTRDAYKFNRGKLLNIGFLIATDPHRLQKYFSTIPKNTLSVMVDSRFNSFSFHDVDLLPGKLLGNWYNQYPHKPLHIGAVWQRYQYDNYVGGILNMNEQDIRTMNGFPNNFWGWGGEDDEFYLRLQDTKLLPVNKLNVNELRTLAGDNSKDLIIDLEEVLIQERGGERAGVGVKLGGHTEWRNMFKYENLDRHKDTWRQNGVNSADFVWIQTRQINPYVSVITVDLQGQNDPQAQKQKPAEGFTK